MRYLLSLLLLLSACARSACYQDFSPEEIAQEYQTVVQVVRACGGELDGWGSGFAIGRRTVITAAHVVDDCEDPFFLVMTPDGEAHPALVDAVVEGVDAVRLLTVDDLDRAAALPSTELPELGDMLCMMTGSDADQIGLMRKCGYVGYVNEEEVGLSMYIVPGNSGSPVFDGRGHVVGIATAGIWRPGHEFLTTLVPTNQWAALLEN